MSYSHLNEGVSCHEAGTVADSLKRLELLAADHCADSWAVHFQHLVGLVLATETFTPEQSQWLDRLKEELIDAVIRRFPSCPSWASRCVDRLQGEVS